MALGISLQGYRRDPQTLDRYVERVGRRPAVVHTFQTIELGQHPPTTALAAGHAIGALNLLSWVPHHGLEPILSGELDQDIGGYAQDIRDLGYPIVLRFAHEMNLPQSEWFGDASAVIAAWRRVRGIFEEIGASDVLWLWCPYVHDRGMQRFEPYYPGDDLVDVVGLDGYNWGRQRWWHRWRSFDHVFGASHAVLRRIAPDKPIILAELGCAETGGDKAAWMRDAFLGSVPERFPEIDALVWFDHHRPDHPDWRTDSSPAALGAWREIVADPRYQLPGPELLERLSRGRSPRGSSRTA